MISFHIPTNIMSRIKNKIQIAQAEFPSTHVKMIIYKLTTSLFPAAKSGVCTKTTGDIQGLGSFPPKVTTGTSCEPAGEREGSRDLTALTPDSKTKNTWQLAFSYHHFTVPKNLHLYKSFYIYVYMIIYVYIIHILIAGNQWSSFDANG